MSARLVELTEAALLDLEARRGYQRSERALLAELGVVIAEEPGCRGCGCSESLACPDGCWWAEEGLCSACAKIILVDVGRSSTAAAIDQLAAGR